MSVLPFLKQLFGISNGPFRENIAFEMDYSGTKVRFIVPPRSQVGGTYEIDTTDYNIYDPRHYFSAITNQKKVYRDDIDVPAFSTLATGWSLRESGFMKYDELASISFRPMICHIDRSGSLFNKSIMEQAIDERLTTRYGPENEDGQYKQYYECPVDWKIKTYNGMEWLCFNVNQFRKERKAEHISACTSINQ